VLWISARFRASAKTSRPVLHHSLPAPSSLCGSSLGKLMKRYSVMVYFPKLSEWLWRIDGLFLVCLSSNLLVGSPPLGARSDAGNLNRRCFSSGFYHLRSPFDTRTISSFISYRVSSVFLFASFLRRFFWGLFDSWGANVIEDPTTSRLSRA